MTRTLASVASAAGLLAAVGGCGGAAACPAVECPDGVHVSLDDVVPAGTPFTIEACVENACEEHDLDALRQNEPQPTLIVGEWVDPGRTYEVTVTVTAENGDVLARHREPVRVEREWPYGDECPPCTRGSVEVPG